MPEQPETATTVASDTQACPFLLVQKATASKMGRLPRYECEAVRDWMREHAGLHANWLSELHSLAEVSFREHRTSKFIAETLRTYCPGLDVTHGILPHLPTAVVAVLDSAETSNCILLRADIDALPMRPTVCTARVHDDVHHACGHDGHSACLLACAHYLSNNINKISSGNQRSRFKKIVMLWQPGEEKGGGANVILQKCGFLRTLHTDIQEVYALHSWPGYRIGTIVTGIGPSMAESGTFTIEITGTG